MVEPKGKKYLISQHTKYGNTKCLIVVPEIIAVTLLHASLRLKLCAMILMMTVARTVNSPDPARFAGLPLVNVILKSFVLDPLLHALRMWLVMMAAHARMVYRV